MYILKLLKLWMYQGPRSKRTHSEGSLSAEQGAYDIVFNKHAYDGARHRKHCIFTCKAADQMWMFVKEVENLSLHN